MQDTYGNTGTYSTTGGGIVSAVFDNESKARDAVDDLRSIGVSESALSVISRRGDEHFDADVDEHDDTGEHAAHAGEGALAGAGIGAATGAIFGLAAAAIPGIGPFITAGALATALGTTAGAAASGAIVGGTSGALAGAMSRWGMSEEESNYYAGEVERGSVYVGVDLGQTTISQDTAMDILRRHGGRSRA